MLDTKFILDCKKKLLLKKQGLIQALNSSRQNFMDQEKGGDEIDQSSALLAEHRTLTFQNKYRLVLVEVEMALSRIEQGTFGFCEETEEPIEEERLSVLPWTRVSIDGAEIREARQKTYNILA